jgi:hypothetical protein
VRGLNLASGCLQGLFWLAVGGGSSRAAQLNLGGPEGTGEGFELGGPSTLIQAVHRACF